MITPIDRIKKLVDKPLLLVSCLDGEELRSGRINCFLFLRITKVIPSNSGSYYSLSMGFRDERFGYEKVAITAKPYPFIGDLETFTIAEELRHFIDHPLDWYRFKRLTQEDVTYLGQCLRQEKDLFYEILYNCMLCDSQNLRGHFYHTVIEAGFSLGFYDIQSQYTELERRAQAALLLEK